MTRIAPANLRCEYQLNPLGLDERTPRLSWRIDAPASRRGLKQSAYQILVASTADKLLAGEGDLWDSGQVRSDRTTQIEYAGKPLRSRLRAWWTVRAWDETGTPTRWATPAFWEMGLLAPGDWKAQWIGSPFPLDPTAISPCPQLRKAFTLRGPVARARLYASALGVYEMWINGRRVGEDCLTPGWTDYAIRIPYQTYDVTPLLHAGENALGGVLADGWYAGFLAWGHVRNLYGSQIQLLAQLEVEYADGTKETLATDRSWKCALGPILGSDFYNGESYDARLEQPGWTRAGFRDAAWKKAKVHPAPAARLVASAAPPVRRIDLLPARTLAQPEKGAFVFDLGQNMVGRVRLTVPAGTRRGTKIVIRHAEVLNPDGTMYTANLRAAKSIDTYVVKGGRGAEVFEPTFAFHGFRYVELRGFSQGKKPSLAAVAGVVMHSDTPPTGSFECSNPMLNQLQHNIVWGQKGNFLEAPTDCPQRDERLGWTGDAQVFVRTACFNMDVAGFFNKWLVDLTDAQSPTGAFPMVAPDVLAKRQGDGGAGWADAGIICPWTVYLAYGDTRVLERHYKAMVKYLAHLAADDVTKRHCFGDWLNQNDPTPNDLIATAFRAWCTQIMIHVAGVLGKKADAARFARTLADVRDTFNREFVTPAGRLTSPSQTGYVLALQFGLLPRHLRPAALARLVRRIGECNDHLSTGFLGTPYLLSVLADNGRLDLAYKLLLNEDFPSWGYPVKHGATTMWERWDGWRHDKGFQDPAMNSFNHYAYGAVGDWMYRTIAGLDLCPSPSPSQAGYHHALIRPLPGGGLTHARAALLSPHGLLSTHWRITGRASSLGKTFTLSVVIPPNCTATLHIPSTSPVTESGRPATQSPGVKFLGKQAGATVFQVGSGQYEFKAKMNE
ncbi:MAG: family 78 glycoside hydrolase catalytic domain [Planctomycetota bacterium]|nr:family 78 glycoside hydrolase catalytic domain [Planctomycetota bacterium]